MYPGFETQQEAEMLAGLARFAVWFKKGADAGFWWHLRPRPGE